MKTKSKQIFAAIMMVAAVIVFSSTQALSQCNPAGKCGGNCPTLWRHGANAAINVPPYSPDGTGHCHKIKPPGSNVTGCGCEYRVSGTENTCTLNSATHLCGGDCPTLYPTEQDALNQTNPITFSHIECHTFTTGNTSYCTCIYY